ncbi:MAG: ABC transporter permease [Candidatus Asgardarchaeia archaeon]
MYSLKELLKKENIQVIKAVFKVNWLYTIRYKGWFLFAIIFPLIMATLPILVGTAVAGSPQKAAENFMRNVGTENYQLFSLIGSAVWILAIVILWDFGLWIRQEQQLGTLEQNLLTPTNIFVILVGVSLFGLSQAAIQFAATLIVGGIIFNVLYQILTPTMLLSIFIIVVGLIPMYGLSFVIGSIVIKYKEANSIISMLQMFFAFIMGIFYPVTLFPFYLRIIAYLLPLTIPLQDARAVLLNTQVVIDIWIDLSIIVIFSIIWPILGYFMFLKVEEMLKKGEGIGGY